MKETKRIFEETLQLAEEAYPAAEPAAEPPAEPPSPVLTLPEEEPAPFAVCELPRLRTENRKVFRMSDGTEQAVFYPEPVHILDPSTGTFKEADNTLSEEADGRYFRNGLGRFTARFSREETTDELFAVEKDAHRLTVSLRQTGRRKASGVMPRKKAHTGGDRAADTLVFGDLLAATDMEYTVTDNGVKENILVKERADTYRYSFTLTCQNLIAAHDKASRTVTFTDPITGEAVFEIPAPFMIDANGEPSDAVSYELRTVGEDTYRFTVKADGDWINAPERAFPVTIDPAVNVSANAAIKSYSWAKGTMSTANEHHVGTLQGTPSCYESRLYMTLALPTLPQQARVKKAELIFRQRDCHTCQDPMKLALYPVTTAITTGKCTPTDTGVMLDYERMHVGDDKTYTFDVTALIDRKRAGGTVTGIVLKPLGSCACQNYVTLFGTAYSTSKPTLAITYESTYGVNTAYRTHTHDLGWFGQGSIDLQTGNLMFDVEDFAWSGNRLPVTIRHQYNTAMADLSYTQNKSAGLNIADFGSTKLGSGWRLNLMQSMVEITFQHEGKSYSGYVFTDENGNETYFKPDEKKAGLFVSINGDGTTYNVSDRALVDGEVTRTFDGGGRLATVSDGHNTMRLDYSGTQLNIVYDGAGRNFGFSYSQKLTSIDAPDNTKVQYTYDTAGRLTAIIRPDGRKAALDYEGYLPVCVTLYDETAYPVYRVQYEYDDAGRVSGVTEFGKGYIGDSSDAAVAGSRSRYTYSIAARRTQVVTATAAQDGDPAEEITTVYAFDADGNVVSTYAYQADCKKVGIGNEGSGIIPYTSGETGVVSNANNLLLNHALQNYTGWDCTGCKSSTFAFHNPRSDTTPLFGRTHLYMCSTDAAAVENGLHQTSLRLPAGDYTFSTYLRVETAFTGADGVQPGAYIRVTDTAGKTLAESERLTVKDGEYIRVVAPFTLAAEASVQVHILADGSGRVAINAPQLEHNAFASDYDLLQNGNFERTISAASTRPTAWTLVGTATTTAEKFNMRRCLKAPAGSITSYHRAYQDVTVKQASTTRETFTLSGWAKASNAIVNRHREGCADAVFRLRAEIKYKDVIEGEDNFEEYTADFSPYTDEWQFASVQFAKSACRPVAGIRVWCEFNNNVGDAYFDDIQLVRNSIETDLAEGDFTTVRRGTSMEDETEEETASSASDAAPTDFEEVRDSFGNALTETTFTDGEFGTIYRSFGFNTDVISQWIDNRGNDRVRETDARGNDTAYTVDGATSRNKDVIDRCSNKTSYEYDTAGRVTRVSNTAAKRDTSGAVLHDADGSIQFETAPRATVDYAYNAFNDLTAITRGDGAVYELTYNAFHRLESIGLRGLDKPFVTYGYKNGSGRLKQVTYANGHTMQATYNALGQMVSEKWTDAAGHISAEYRYIYDGSGNLVRSIDKKQKKEYTYIYESGRLARAAESSITLTDDIVTKKMLLSSTYWSYDPEGNLTRKRIVPVDGDEQIVYYEHSGDKDQTVVKFRVGEQTVTAHSHTDSFGRKTFDELQLGTGTLSRRFTYHDGALPEVHRENARMKSSPTTRLVRELTFSDGRTIAYEYDPEERITKVTDSTEGTWEYTYDPLGQLLTERHNGMTVNRMTYDSYGNILSKNGKLYGYDNAWRDKLICVGGRNMVYDAQGNPTTYMGKSLTWEKGRQLKALGSNIYTYNANGIRTGKKVGTVQHTYTLDGTKIQRETWDGNTLIPLYDNEDDVCGVIYNGAAYYFQKNLQGDIIAITDQNAETVARYTYDAWGVCTVTADTSTDSIATVNPFRYRGYYYDTETGLYYLQSRYYDPTVGRFINVDEAGLLVDIWPSAEYNLFAYCMNAPVNHQDYMGYGSVTPAMNTKTCPRYLVQAIRNSGLNHTRMAILEGKDHYCTDVAYLGNGFYAVTFTYGLKTKLKWESTYIVIRKTKGEWEKFIKEKTKFQYALVDLASFCSDFLGCAPPNAPDAFAYVQFACDLVSFVFGHQFSFEKYINQQLRQNDASVVNWTTYHCGRKQTQQYHCIALQVTNTYRMLCRTRLFFGDYYWKTIESITYRAY